MVKFKQQYIKDIEFTLDLKLNVIRANQLFSRFFNTTNPIINLRDYIENSDEFNDLEMSILGLKDYILKTIDLTIENITYDTLIYLKYNNDETYTGYLIETNNIIKSFNNININSTIQRSLLSEVNMYFFYYNCSTKNITFSNTREMATLFEGDIERFNTYINRYFDVNEKSDCSLSLQHELYDDLNKGISNKNYKILLQNSNYLNIHTKNISYDDKNFILGILNLGNNVLTNKNSQADKIDGLTELLNKKTIEEVAYNKINLVNSPTTIMILDIDRFKDFNDNFGHAFGDKVLVSVAKVIKESLEGIGSAGRFGGDEFLCVIDSVDEDKIRNISKNIRLGIQWAISADNPSNVVTCSIGIARYPDNGNDYDTIFKLADKCLYIAKNKGRNCYVIYHPEIHDNILIERENEALKRATGLFYYDEACIQNQIYELSVNKQIPDCLKMLREYLGCEKITVYDKDNKLLFMDGIDDNDYRSHMLNDPNYYIYFNEYNYLLLDNTTSLQNINRDLFKFYLLNNIASVFEIKISDGRLICFDKYKPAKTFDKTKITFVLFIIKNRVK
ncbi:MAG: GGDEF domain-containing protein [Anaeroplasmataceae bacterium]